MSRQCGRRHARGGVVARLHLRPLADGPRRGNESFLWRPELELQKGRGGCRLRLPGCELLERSSRWAENRYFQPASQRQEAFPSDADKKTPFHKPLLQRTSLAPH